MEGDAWMLHASLRWWHGNMQQRLRLLAGWRPRPALANLDSKSMQQLDVHPRLTTHCQLGEGISWHAGSAAWPHAGFFFVDIHGCALHFVSEDWARHQVWTTAERLGWLIASDDGCSFLAGFQSGVAKVALGEHLTVLSWPCRLYAEQPAMRLNDAKADASGRLWIGSLNNDDESLDAGALFRLASDGVAQEVDAGYKVANGPAISADQQLLLHTDSARRRIYAFDLEASTGTLSGKRVWKQFADEDGYPDGMNFDAAGTLWVAHWGAGLISRFSLDGSLLARVKLPVSNVTNVAFGGTGMRTLVATTAWAGLTTQERAEQPLAGAVFEITGHATSGLPPYAARL